MTAGGGSALSSKKPKLLFFQWDHQPNQGLSHYMLLHANQHVKCLSCHFDVQIVNYDCDYAEVCDRYEPDVVLVESGFQSWVSRRPRITNKLANPHIPKLGFHNADAWGDRRSGFFSDMEEWGIGTFFSICTTTNEYMPYAAESTFIWPNFIDPDLFHDHGLEKVVPLMVSGKHGSLYPWRRSVYPLVTQLFPAIVLPQFAYESALAPRTLSGEPYARAINSAKIALTCGTMAREVVRKHFEIPACGTCLVTEESAVLRAAGFEHMKNCVFAEPSDVVDVIDYLLQNPDVLDAITCAGHQLVHARHTISHRPQIYQWFMLQSSLSPNHRIVQPGPFEDLVAQPRIEPLRVWVSSEGQDRPLVNRGFSLLWNGQFIEAEALFARCLRYESYIPEPRFGIAMCRLHLGHPREAIDVLAKLIEGTTVDYGAAEPDPIEWTCFLLALLCNGEVERAADLCTYYPDLDHYELSRAKAVARFLAGRIASPNMKCETNHGGRKTVHIFPHCDERAWLDWIAGLLVACRQETLAARLRSEGDALAADVVQQAAGMSMGQRFSHALDRLLSGKRLARVRPNVPPIGHFNYLRHVRLNVVRIVTQYPAGAHLRALWRRHRARRELAALRVRVKSTEA